MKYIKTYEDTYDILIPGNMYFSEETNTLVCYIGNNGKSYPLTFLIFGNGNDIYYLFIEWAKWLNFKPLNITLKDYIIDNDLVNITLLSFKINLKYTGYNYPVYKRSFSSGPNYKGTSIKMIKELEKRLLEDEDIQYHKELEKSKKNYNL